MWQVAQEEGADHVTLPQIRWRSRPAGHLGVRRRGAFQGDASRGKGDRRCSHRLGEREHAKPCKGQGGNGCGGSHAPCPPADKGVNGRLYHRRAWE